MAIAGGAAFPRRMNLVELTFLPYDHGNTKKDKHFRTPVRTKKFGTPIIIFGQINLGSKKFDELLQSYSTGWNTPGNLTESEGHVVITPTEVERVGYKPSIGDKLIKYADFEPPEGTELLVDEVRPESPLRGNALLFYVSFAQDLNKR